MELVIPFIPHKKQKPFLESTAKFRSLFTGAGFGKTAIGVVETLRLKVEYPDAIFVMMAPTFRMVKNVILPEFFKWCPKKIIVQHKKADREIWLAGQSAPIVYLSADNERHIDRLRGMTIGGAWLDELAMFQRLVWEVILARLRDKNGPLKIIGTSTPRGFGWPYWYFVRGQNPKNKKKLRNAEAYEWFGGTTMDNPFTPDSYKQTLLDTYSGKFARQEIYGEFTNFEGLVYSNFTMADNVVSELPELKEFIFSFDWGFTNPTAGVIIGFDYDGRAYVIEEYYRSKTPVEDAIEWAKQMSKKYKFEMAYGDPASPEHVHKFNSEGLSMHPADNAVLAGVNTVFNMVEKKEDGLPRLFFHERCTNCIDEIQEYRYREAKEDRKVREDQFEGMDHLMDAVRYALQSHKIGNRGFAVLTDDDGVIF